MKSSCIAWPEHEPLLLIRKSQLKLCDNNHCAAALLSFFEHWHNIKVAAREQAEHRNRVARQHGEEGTQDTSLLQFHNEQGLEQGLMGLYGRKTIRGAMELLVNRGFVSIHENPSSRYRFDKTHYFLFHPEEVSLQLIDICDEVKVPHREGEKASSSGKNTSPCGKNTSTRTEITSEITSENNPPSIISPPVAPLPPTHNGIVAIKRQEAHKREGAKRCPDTFVPKEETRVWARDKYPNVDFDEACAAMRDWEFKDARSDWDAVLRTWIRNEAKHLASHPPRRVPGNNGFAPGMGPADWHLEDEEVSTHG